MSIEPLIFAFIFIGVLLMVQGRYLLAFGKQTRLSNNINRRLALLKKGRGRRGSADPTQERA